jgi:hypothetical protein
MDLKLIGFFISYTIIYKINITILIIDLTDYILKYKIESVNFIC